MANKQLFASAPRGRKAPETNAVNSESAPAYALEAEEALAQYVSTGALGATFYASAEEQLDKILELAAKCSPEFVAQCAVYGRSSAFMKDAPALLVAHLTSREGGLIWAKRAFPRVINNPKMLRTFCQIVRSGKVGRKSFGTAVKKLIQGWFDARTDEQIFRGSIGNDPRLSDVIKMAHPKPSTPARAALYGYLLGKKHDPELLCTLVRSFETWKAGVAPLPDVPFMMLTGGELTPQQWSEIAQRASWQTLRMNLNTFQRHGVFKNATLVQALAARLAVPEQKVFPYQLFAAYKHVNNDVPLALQNALQDAMEAATKNVPTFEGKQVIVCVDISNSMNQPVTGARGSATSAITCRDVSALFAASIVRANPTAGVIPFSDDVVKFRVNPRDSVMTISNQLNTLPSGGTNCSAPLAMLNKDRTKADVLIYVSDNESWIDGRPASRYNRSSGTETMRQWEAFRVRNPQAKLVCIDVVPNETRQQPTRDDILNIGGFSDNVFTVVDQFVRGETRQTWVKFIREISFTTSAPVVEESASVEG